MAFITILKKKITKKKDDFIEAFANKKNDYTMVIANFVDKIENNNISIIKNKDILKQRHLTIYAPNC